MVSLNPEILKCSDGVRTMYPCQISRGVETTLPEIHQILKNAHPTPWRFTVSFWGTGENFSFPLSPFFFPSPLLFFYSTEHDTPIERKKRKEEIARSVIIAIATKFVRVEGRSSEGEVSRGLRGWLRVTRSTQGRMISCFFFFFFFVYDKFLWHWYWMAGRLTKRGWRVVCWGAVF